jgi:hypothetical protein
MRRQPQSLEEIKMALEHSAFLSVVPSR